MKLRDRRYRQHREERLYTGVTAQQITEGDKQEAETRREAEAKPRDQHEQWESTNWGRRDR